MMWTLFKWETYKLFHSKMTIIIVFLMVLLAILMGMPLGRSQETREIHNAMYSLDGSVIDNALMQEMNEAINWADPDWNKNNYKYRGLQYLVSLVADDTKRVYTADDFYALVENNQKLSMIENKLTAKEMDWWELDKNKIKTPFTYISSFNARTVVEYMPNILLLLLLLAATRVSTVFACENRYKTDAIILSTKNGRWRTFVAKVFSSFVFILIMAVVLTLTLVITVYFDSGLSGLYAIIQMEFPIVSYPFTFLEFFIVQLVILCTASILFASISMALSAFLRNEIAVMGVMFGVYLALSFFYIPNSYRTLSQVTAMVPKTLISFLSLVDNRLINIFGTFFTMYSFAPIVYVLASLVLCFVTYLFYRRCQVTSR